MLYLGQPHITIMELTAKQAKHTKHACYFAYLAMSSIFSLPPLLFNTFRAMYGISYTLLGTLVLINFCTQLAVDLIFTFFTKYFNPHKTVRIMPCLTTLGLLVYALIPTLFPQIAYVGFVAGTVIFSIAAGLCEVMLSPTVAALPSDNPDRDMSMLHSLYGWGVLMVIVISTLFLNHTLIDFLLRLSDILFAAALSEYEAAVVVGEPTTGKGYFQVTYELVDGSAVGVSIGKYFTPKGVSLAETGVTPDLVVPVEEEEAAGIYYGTLTPEEDPQIQAAVKALK